ncbi:glycosyltransferase family 17 protein [Cylindrobasidium torrendii FP15055 ss-10]|uniref:Glycosyltransferase family 17 protein n=1 Tax=Cylindrobasidium torrendii FP15055 ss-10 TaxID=1314674 RepID=A0A0D7AWF1_9AGAR|nr:glycosyltransferase family 17 protein [Cylindrobasidium torrendii FP15055 ss-10]
MALRLSPRLKILLIPALFLTVILIIVLSQYHYQIRNFISYGTRPLWDKADGPSHIIPHFYAEGMMLDTHACKLHGWQPREDLENAKVLDAVLMSSELDLLEIRLNELNPLVDRFFILESNATFTGLPKETYFANNRDRFSQFEKKISYRFVPGYALTDEQTAWKVEANTRTAMTQFLRSYMTEFPPHTQSIVIMSDIDEIPSLPTLKLLKYCDFGYSLHLQLRNYLYSFEWFVGMTSWRASVQLWDQGSFYSHRKSTDFALADAGWHCSYCFRTLGEYITKMTGFSHADRIGGNMKLLDPRRIQDIVCKGTDIFGMLPEAYRYADLLNQMSLEPVTSGMYLPRFLLDNADRFKFLLPGGCKREVIETQS